MDTFGCYGDGDGQFEWPNVIAWDTSGNMYVGDCKTVYSFLTARDSFCLLSVRKVLLPNNPSLWYLHQF